MKTKPQSMRVFSFFIISLVLMFFTIESLMRELYAIALIFGTVTAVMMVEFRIKQKEMKR